MPDPKPTDDKTKTEDLKADAAAPKADDKPVKVPLTLAQELQANVLLIERAHALFEPRLTQRVLRTLTTTRHRVGGSDDGLAAIKGLINDKFPKGHATQTELLSLIPSTPPKPLPVPAAAAAPAPAAESMDVDASTSASPPTAATIPAPAAPAAKAKKEPTEILPEVDVYCRLLTLLLLIDASSIDKAIALATSTVDFIQQQNRRSMDALAAKVYFYLARSYELAQRDGEIRSLLLAAHRTATLRNDPDLQATLINLLLRNYFAHNLLDQADKLVSKSTFPESAGNAQLARYLYYLGRIRAVQLNYTEAHTHLQQAIRRAPSAHIAPGFIQTAYKFFIVVELLMGNIPERTTFRLPVLKTALIPYFQIVQAVRIGDLSAFQTALTTHAPTFTSDSTSTLILRLRHSVLKTALHQISLAYSRISLRDVCAKLQLEDEEDAEFIVGKAIRDGVIQGVGIEHEKGWLVGREGGDVYETGEPRKAFHQRIAFCLDLHNVSVKAMRYPLNAHRSDPASSEAARERARELALEIEEGGDLDEGDDDMDF